MSSLGDTLAEMLKNYRKNQGGKTQQWLADMLDLTRVTINRWENNGAGSATLDQVEMIAKKIDIPSGELIGIIKQAIVEKVEIPKSEWDSIRGFFGIPPHLLTKLSQLDEPKRKKLIEIWDNQIDSVLEIDKNSHDPIKVNKS